MVKKLLSSTKLQKQIDEKEIQLAMNRLKKIETEAKKRLLLQKEKKEKEKQEKEKKDKEKLRREKFVEVSVVETKKKFEEVSIKKIDSKPIANKKKKEPIPTAIKSLVWNKYIGETIASTPCFCCKVTSISMRHFHCGHIKSEKQGGKLTIDNLRPICANCNLSMGSMNMMEFIEKFGLHK